MCCGCSSSEEVQPETHGLAEVEIGQEAPVGQPIGPREDHPIQRIERDAGVSARLRDGSVIWFFGDTARFDGDGTLIEFEVGTAAWASADDPTETLDPELPSAVPFAEPGDEFPECPSDSPVGGMWPLAAVVEPSDSRDRVVVYMLNVCLGESTDAQSRGVSVGEWFYDPSDPPRGARVRVNVLNQVLFAGSDLGAAAFAVGDQIYVYGCALPPSPSNPSSYGPCYAARTSFGAVADPKAYEIWDGRGWARDGVRSPLTLEEAGGVPVIPVGPFSVMHHEQSGGYLMAYSPWPAYTDRIAVRFASHPEGPWSAAKFVYLKGCADRHREELAACYGANLQPALSNEGRLALGYQDQWVGPDETGGAFLVTEIDLRLPGQ